MGTAPNESDAASAARDITGRTPASVRRFGTGSGHYVFEVLFEDSAPIVIRMGAPERRVALSEGVKLHSQLVAHGVPLPAIIGHAFEADWPFVAMERVAGTDLQYVLHALSYEQLRSIAAHVADAQTATARVGVSQRYGFSASGKAAPHTRWSDVVAASLSRSRRRLEANGVFEVETIVAPLESLLDALRVELDALPATPFLHDTTTRNVLIDAEGRFSGIVDVDDLCFGDPRYAPALTSAVIRAYGGPLSYIDAWMGAAGHADDIIFRFYVALFVADLMAEQGMAFNGNEGPRDPQRESRLLETFQQALTIVTRQLGRGRRPAPR
ncbi:hypothetical protein GCM10007989_27900 [Devosia pacifica]|uniref:Aminoglycoside phosphotransferase domain-containing protein n=1 Tax=Devosia pacifica TaxID=1335967 RepID=A0A918S8T6_9HYPH|nr:aminoglycoside phosphotransferase family protein [Devosia pacifica]GHA30507.1 hypothetical protein GCM10007989_27900 [Devosia pacifica]